MSPPTFRNIKRRAIPVRRPRWTRVRSVPPPHYRHGRPRTVRVRTARTPRYCRGPRPYHGDLRNSLIRSIQVRGWPNYLPNTRFRVRRVGSVSSYSSVRSCRSACAPTFQCRDRISCQCCSFLPPCARGFRSPCARAVSVHTRVNALGGMYMASRLWALLGAGSAMRI